MYKYSRIVPETEEEKVKRSRIELTLKNENATLADWQSLAISDYGLVNGMIHLSMYMLLVL